MFLSDATHPLADIGVADTGIVAGLGYALVFAGLIALMVVVIIVGKAFTAANRRKDKAAAVPVTVAEPEPIPEPQAPTAPGSAGQLKIYDVPPKTAAMLMCIVANQMGKPLNELRFISIKEVK